MAMPAATEAALPPPESLAVFRTGRLVVKVGSALLVGPDGRIRTEWLRSLVADIAAARAAGQQVIIVSSGSIALGSRRLNLPKGGRASLEDAQAAAACGQILLAGHWSDLLSEHGIVAAQMLVTLSDFEDRRRYLNAAATLERLLSLGAVPILNENDSVATEEIRFGDNDRLAARAAQAAQAHALVLLSDIDGLYTGNPHRDPDARFVPLVSDIDSVRHMATAASASGMGSGGMLSKLEAARIAHAAGVTVAIAAGAPMRPLSALLETRRCTVFLAPDALRARKAWIAGRMRVMGAIRIDSGAVDALRSGKSLLAPGILSVTGSFARGDALDILGPDGERVARGLTGYDDADLVRIAGRRRDEIADILGHAPRSAVIHRDHLVLL